MREELSFWIKISKLTKSTQLTCVTVGEPLHNVDNKLIIVETDEAVAFGSGMLADAFVVDEAFPGVPCVPVATVGPAAFDNRLSNSTTRPNKKSTFN